jgi:hypothetical protein
MDFDLLNIGVVGSNPTRGMDVRVFLCCAVMTRYRLCDGPITRPGNPTETPLQKLILNRNRPEGLIHEMNDNILI